MSTESRVTGSSNVINHLDTTSYEAAVKEAIQRNADGPRVLTLTALFGPEVPEARVEQFVADAEFVSKFTDVTAMFVPAEGEPNGQLTAMGDEGNLARYLVLIDYLNDLHSAHRSADV